jgi:RHS repeat-associated protein
VRFRAGVLDQDKETVAAARGARRGRKLRGSSGLEKLTIESGQDAAALAAELRANPAVEWAEPNFLITKSQAIPDDVRFNEQWALRNDGQMGGASDADINATTAWQKVTGAPGTIIAVIDSGVDFTHPDLRNNQWTNGAEKENGKDDDHDGFVDDLRGWDWVADSGTVRDEQGHGTAVAGIIAAEGNNGEGVAGVMWRASLMSLRVLDQMGMGDVASAIEAIDYAATHGAQVINISWGMEDASLGLSDALERAGRAGAVVVCSAGNGGRDIGSTPYYPASFDLPNLIAVASTDSFDQLTSWTNRGAARVAVAAPGADILTTKMGGGYLLVSGTSASAPLVSGIAGLVRTAQPWLSAAAVRQAIMAGARHVSLLEGSISSAGVANAAGAIEAARSGLDIAPGNGNGQGGDNGNGQGDQSPRPPTPGHGGGGPGEFDVEPPEQTRGRVENLPGLDEIRRRASHKPKAPPSVIEGTCPRGDRACTGEEIESNVVTLDPEYSTARIRPENETGTPDVNLGSRNYNWSLPIVNLEGRAGLDLDLTLYYNSLVWTKQGTDSKFNLNRGFPRKNGIGGAPGFELQLPFLQQRYQNQDFGGYAYILITPTGGRVELRQVGTSNVYESADGSYSRLVDNGTTGGVTISTPDGTLYTFGYADTTTNQFGQITVRSRRCTEIKDRNGNFITAAYNTTGGITSITDTLGRVINFNYDPTANVLTSITQTQNGATYTWATFSFGVVDWDVNFTPPDLANNSNGGAVQVLTGVGLADGSSYRFDYNTYAQVYRITHYAADGHTLSYVYYNLPLDGSVEQSDCPRFTEQREWAENWNNGQEVITTYSVAADNSWSQVTLPDSTPLNANDNVVHKEYFATTGWQKGLPTRTETFLAGTPTTILKWTTTLWTQDDETLTYMKNPRPTQTNVFDASGNQRQARISYVTNSGISLPSSVEEYGEVNNVLTRMRVTTTDYKWDAAYLSRRILGLVSQRKILEGDAVTLRSKMVYTYDLGGEHMANTATAPLQHDTTYGTSFILGRGNVCQVERFDVNDPNNVNNSSVVSKTGYNITGSVAFTRDHLLHNTLFYYTDDFSDTTKNGNKYAYPTRVRDADGFEALTKYNYDMGVVTRQQTPLANSTTNQPGPVVTFIYDAAWRLARVDSLADGAYTRWVYPASQTYLRTVTKVSAASPTEFSSEEHFDGMGRVRLTSAQFPGSTGGNRITKVEYDVLGRVARQSNPTETDVNWNVTGDDAATGMQWTVHAYDWNNRPTLTTNPDGTTTDLSYGGCGCAGGDMVTARDERGRQRKLYKDALGRLAKVEEMQWASAGGGIYATTTYTYNARDQITQLSQQGRLRTFQYDGHGRQWKKTTPEQGTVEYLYNADDTLASMKDARGAKALFGYNNRHLVTSLSYDLSGVLAGQSVAATPGVTYTYDAAGNRLSMTERNSANAIVGSTTYHYDQLSRMDWEERSFGAGLAGTYRLSYTYNLAGQLTRVTNPWAAQVSYTYDYAGQLTGVTGANYAGVATYAQNLQHRAFGGVKAMTYGNSKQLSVTYDNRMRVKRWDIPTVMGWDYSYNNFSENTGRVTYARNLYDTSLDRSYDYDNVGRLVAARTGPEARAHVGLAQGNLTAGPYSHNYVYDQWGNATQRSGWGGERPSWTETYNTKNQRVGYSYDLSGDIISDGVTSYTYDADGRQATSSYSGYSLQQWYDGDRLRVQKLENGVDTYYLRSTVLGGQAVAEIAAGGVWARGYVYLGSDLLAVQQSASVSWIHTDPVAKSKRATSSAGAVTSVVELDPWGSTTERMVNSALQPRWFTTYLRDAGGSDDAMHRRYNRYYSRFEQPDSYDGSYDFSNPQSFNRYAYVANDPVNLIDPTGLSACFLAYSYTEWSDSSGRVVGISNYRSSIICFGDGGGMAYSQSRRPPQRNPQTNVPFNQAGIKKGIEEALKNPECADFVKELLDAVATKGNPLYKNGDISALFDSLASQSKGGFTRTAPPGSAGYGNASGLVSKGDASIYLFGNPNISSAAQTILDTMGTFHELMHLAGSKGRYTDRRFAEVVRGNPAWSNLSRAPWPGDKSFQFFKRASKNDNDGAWSSYWGDVLIQKCFGGK